MLSSEDKCKRRTQKIIQGKQSDQTRIQTFNHADKIVFEVQPTEWYSR